VISEFDLATSASQFNEKKGDNLQGIINEIQKKFHKIKISPAELVMD
jgi:hypothetical protein